MMALPDLFRISSDRNNQMYYPRCRGLLVSNHIREPRAVYAEDSQEYNHLRKIFADTLQEIRTGRGISQGELALRCGLGPGFILLLEHAKRAPSFYEQSLQTIRLNIGEEYRSKRLRRYTIIKTPDDIYAILRAILKILDDDQVHVILLILNRENRVTGYKVLSSGTRYSYALDTALVFRNSILLGATSIIIAHTDPSGSARFLREDMNISEQLIRLGRLHNIPVLDHVIMSPDNFRSLREYSRSFYRFVEEDIAAEQGRVKPDA